MKKRTHVKKYYRRKHGTSNHGGTVKAHDKNINTQGMDKAIHQTQSHTQKQLTKNKLPENWEVLNTKKGYIKFINKKLNQVCILKYERNKGWRIYLEQYYPQEFIYSRKGMSWIHAKKQAIYSMTQQNKKDREERTIFTI